MECVYCHDEVGSEVGEIPVMVTDEFGGEREPWCPACFCYIRSPMEPSRYVVGNYFPIICSSCQVTSVAVGQKKCMQCGSASIRLTFPKTNVLMPC